MFSTSMIASSTTTPMATTSPASTITFTVAPRRSRTSRAATSDSGMAIRLMKAVRHSKRNAMMIRMTSRMPINIAIGEVVERLLDERRGAEDRRVDLYAGQSRLELIHRRLDPVGDLQRVGAAELLDDEHDARSVVDDGVADQRAVVDDDLAHVGESQHLTVPLHHRHRHQLRGPDDGLDVADVETLPVVLDEAAGSDDRTLGVLEQAGLKGVRRGVHHLLERDVVLRRASPGRPGRAAAAAARPRWRPGPPRAPAAAGRGSSSRRLSTGRSGSTTSDVRPIFMMRLVDDSAGIMNGGLAQVGSVAVTCAMRSATS